MTNFKSESTSWKNISSFRGVWASIIFEEQDNWINTQSRRLKKKRSGNLPVKSSEGKAMEEYIQYYL